MYKIEPKGVLRQVRTEYGKVIRKEYESGNLDISRHDFLVNEIRDDEIANTLSTVSKDNILANEVKVAIKEATSVGFAEARVIEDSVNFSFPNSTTRRGRVGVGVAQTLETQCNQGVIEYMGDNLEHSGFEIQLDDNTKAYAVWYEKEKCYVVLRKLTPKEYWRLQGWSDEDFAKAEFVNSDSQLYKQAGNSVTVPVIEYLGKKLVNMSC